MWAHNKKGATHSRCTSKCLHLLGPKNTSTPILSNRGTSRFT